MNDWQETPTGAEQPRYFTLDEANRTLPLVQRIVFDILEAYPRFQRRVQEFDRLASEDEVGRARDRLQDLREAIDQDAEAINAFLRELADIGCFFKGFEEGLVDFYALYRGRPILLCWRLGEDSIQFWHDVDAGFAGRRPVHELSP